MVAATPACALLLRRGAPAGGRWWRGWAWPGVDARHLHASAGASRGAPPSASASASASSSVTLEVRPGSGGVEAASFAADLFRMYRSYVAARPGWSWSEMAALPASTGASGGGVRLAAARVAGPGAAAALAGEAGVHRVQRVPASESSGRTHTSAATVAVLVEEEVEGGAPPTKKPTASSTRRTRPRDAATAGAAASAAASILDPATVRIDTFRASGAGGQHVNCTDSAVRAVHLQTGVAVVARGDRSQHKNRAAALAALAARLGAVAGGQAASARASTRKAQVGTGDRSARVRTYSFPAGRVTDHRSGVVVRGDVGDVLSGRRLGELLLLEGGGET